MMAILGWFAGIRRWCQGEVVVEGEEQQLLKTQQDCFLKELRRLFADRLLFAAGKLKAARGESVSKGEVDHRKGFAGRVADSPSRNAE